MRIVVLMPWEHVSASQIDTYLSCQRKWWLDKIGADGVRIESPSQALGKAVHSNIENYLRDGSPLDHPLLTLDTFIASVKARVGVELLIEYEFSLPGAKNAIGFIDLVVVDHVSKTIEIWDHKTTKDWRYAKTAGELSVNPQGRLYVLAMHAKYGDDYRYFFGHHVILTAKPALARTTQVEYTPVMIATGRLAVEMTVRSMVVASEIVDGRDVVPNLSECWKYGGCQYRAQCQGTDPMPALTEIGHKAPEQQLPLPGVPRRAAPNTIYIDCVDLKQPYVSFSDWTASLEEEFKRDVGKDAIAVKYAEGVIAIATKARDLLEAPETLFIRTSDAAAMKYLDLVEAKVPRVIQSIR